ncbi:hypothetical protein D3C75_1198140 [compost metagenome]
MGGVETVGFTANLGRMMNVDDASTVHLFFFRQRGAIGLQMAGQQGTFVAETVLNGRNGAEKRGVVGHITSLPASENISSV